MVNIKSATARVYAAVFVFALLAVSILPILNNNAYAIGSQVSSRSITMSQSAKGATGVTYTITFTPSATSAQSLVIDFCAGVSGSPLIGSASCTQAAADVPNFTGATFGSGTGTMGGWTTGSTLSTGRIKLNGSANTSATAQTIILNGVANPTTTVGTFYARLTTYSQATYTDGTTAYSAPATPGGYLDYGGFALSTTNSVAVSAVVQEKLEFTVTNTTIKIGSGTPLVIDNAAVTIGDNPVNLSVATNAINGVSVSLKGSEIANGTKCLDGGTVNSTCADTSTAGGALNNTTNNFGICTTTGGGLTTAHAGYSGATCTIASNFGWNPATYAVGSGDTIYTTSPTGSATGSVIYGAEARSTSPAGIYSATHDYIATGIF